MKNKVFNASALIFFAGLISDGLQADTNVYFTQDIDRRFAWLGNDANANEDFVAHVINLVNSATTSIDASTMSFSSTQIGQALANRAKAGVRVRVVMNGKHRYQPGVMQLLKAQGAQVIDDNLPALVARVNFQRPTGSSPTGWLTDTGGTFGPKPGGFNYGWTTDVSTHMLATPDASYQSSLLGHAYARPNSDGTFTWEFEVPNGYYYVHLVIGQPTFNPHNVITVEGQNVLQTGSGYTDEFTTHGDAPGVDPDGLGPIPAPPPGVDAEEDDFRSATVSSGEAQRIQVSDGRLSISVGRTGTTSYSSLCFVEIYRGDADPEGNPGTIENHVQKFGITHSKYLIIDGNRVWISSANLTNGAAGRSEDAIETTDPNVIAAFQTEFNGQWGNATPTPDATASHFKRFKTNGAVTAVVPGVLSSGAYNWNLFFSPSRTSVGLDVANLLSPLITASTNDLIFSLEQFTSAGSANGFNTSQYLMNQVATRINGGHRVWGVFGNANASDPVFALDDTHPNAFMSQQIAEEDGIGLHDKFLLVDALHDSRYVGRGKALVGSMNWSQSGIASNDEQSVIINDPAIANQFLQRAMKALADEGLNYNRLADIVLVLDRSYSMNLPTTVPGVSKLDASKLAADAFLGIIETDIGNRVALTRFGSNVEPFPPTDSELTAYNTGSQAALMTLINSTLANGPLANSTCYGCALQRVHDQFQHGIPLHPRRIVHFFTDGLENTMPWADGVYQTLIADFGAEIHSTAFGAFSPYAPGGTAAILGTMASASGGSFAQLENLSPGALQKRFIEVARDASDLDSLLDPDFIITAGKPVSTSVAVDSTARNAQFIVYWGNKQNDIVDLRIKTPWGLVLDPSSPGVRVVKSAGSINWHIDLLKLGAATERKISGNYLVTLALNRKAIEVKRATVGLAVLAGTDVSLKSEFIVKRRGADKGLLLARMLNQGKSIKNCTMQVLWNASAVGSMKTPRVRKLRLFDDGKHSDGKANDGLFGLPLSLDIVGSRDFHIVAEASFDAKNKLGVTKVRRESHSTTTVDLAKPYKGKLPEEPKPSASERR